MPDFVSMKHAVESFDKRNGADCIRIGSVLLYSNGAIREPLPHGLLQEPPADARKRCELTLKYQQELLRRAMKEFTDEKHAIQQTCAARSRDGHPPLDSRSVAHLHQLRLNVRKQQKQVKAAEWELEQNTPEQVKRSNACRARNQQANETLLEEVQKIRV